MTGARKAGPREANEETETYLVNGRVPARLGSEGLTASLLVLDVLLARGVIYL